ncbi:MAG: hypothetical protein GTO46_15375 [Gemmatimonadetes bacterium]|nr:hypothetical protein [Gemmatimonadota bacterium]NIO33018.1 hypothetical protein [Gemmatimonadota bacterium]
MEHAIRRIFMFLLGVSLGYCTGFRDANNNEHMIFVRMIHRVQSFAEQVIGEPASAVEEAAEEVER